MKKNYLYILLFNINQTSKDYRICYYSSGSLLTGIIGTLIIGKVYNKYKNKKIENFNKNQEIENSVIHRTENNFSLNKNDQYKNFNELMDYYNNNIKNNLQIDTYLSNDDKNIGILKLIIKNLTEKEIEFLNELNKHIKDIEIIFIENINNKEILETLKILKNFKINTLILEFNKNNEPLESFQLTNDQIYIINNLNFLIDTKIEIHINEFKPKGYYYLDNLKNIPANEENKYLNLPIYKQIINNCKNKYVKKFKLGIHDYII